MDKEAVLRWKAGWEEVERVRIEEMRALTMEDRWREMRAIGRRANLYGFYQARPDIDEALAERWEKIRKAHGIERAAA